MDEIEYWGNDILASSDILYADREEVCQAFCSLEPECNAWTFDRQDERCYLKTTMGNDIRSTVPDDSKDFISGPKTCDGEFLNKHTTFLLIRV